ncbi:MAG: hypothetical protein AAF483_15385 [Planctomycetota bacterium]
MTIVAIAGMLSASDTIYRHAENAEVDVLEAALTIPARERTALLAS